MTTIARNTTKKRALTVRERKMTVTSPGETILINGAAVATIWSDGPKVGTVWALTDDGGARVYKTPTKNSPAFVDTGLRVSQPSARWATLLGLVIAGRGIVICATPDGVNGSTPYDVHLPGCADSPARDDTAEGQLVEHVSGCRMLDWLHGRPVTDRLGCGFAPLGHVLEGRWCACMGEAGRAAAA